MLLTFRLYISLDPIKMRIPRTALRGKTDMDVIELLGIAVRGRNEARDLGRMGVG